MRSLSLSLTRRPLFFFSQMLRERATIRLELHFVLKLHSLPSLRPAPPLSISPSRARFLSELTRSRSLSLFPAGDGIRFFDAGGQVEEQRQREVEVNERIV